MSNENRTPKDLRGLLKFCMEITKNEDSTISSTATELSSERRAFLDDVFKNISVDVIKEFTKCISILIDPKVQDENEDDVSEQEMALDVILDWGGQIDIANNFHKIGGFQVLVNCLKSPHSSLRASGANVIAELSQNNPYTQGKMNDENFIPLLLTLLDTDRNETVRIKALYALSCIIREYQPALVTWEKHEGPSILIRSLMSGICKLKIKSCFFLSSIFVKENNSLIDTFVSMGIVQQFIGLLVNSPHDESHEHIARSLLCISRLSPKARQELRVQNILKTHIENINAIYKDNEEFEYELDFYKQINTFFDTVSTQECER